MNNVYSPSADDRRNALRLWVDYLRARKVITSRSNWCKKAGVAEGGVRDFVSGRNESMNEATYIALAAAAGIKPENLRYPPKNDNDLDEDEMLNIYRLLSNDQKEKAISALKEFLFSQEVESSTKETS